jgi:hypothetical protein
MFARMLLPRLGGSPAVWNVALVFYQAVLLAGYGYAHLTTRWLGVRRQTLLHAVVMLLPLAVLPIRLPAGWAPSSFEHPMEWLLLALLIGVGLPFFVVSTTGPLVQRWLAGTSHPAASDPYFLYATSNLGSFAGLMTYPFIAEPLMGLGLQSRTWAWGYAALVVCLVVCAILVRSRPGAPGADDPPSAGADLDDAPIRPQRRLRWVALAFAPSSLLLGVTLHLSTDIAAVPLLWVVPLALYLLTFTLAFARRRRFLHPVALRAFPLLLLPLLVVLVARAIEPLLLVAGLHLLVLFVASLICHGALAADRPHPRQLTEFYFWIALGGVLGGVFSAILAPLIFNTVLEYPIALVLVCLLAPPIEVRSDSPRARRLDVLIPLALAGLVIALAVAADRLGHEVRMIDLVVAGGLMALILFSFSRRPVRFGLGVLVMLFAGSFFIARSTGTLLVDRSFFGVNRVTEDRAHDIRWLLNGTTVHGVQRLASGERGEPWGYYSRQGPAGDIFGAAVNTAPGRHVAVAGLGVGSLAAYGAAGQQWDFYEIDPLVVRIARNPRYFTFLADCPARVRVVLGDARRSLAATGTRYDLIVLDAYSSDAIPVHLLTREALALYLEHLRPDGVLAFHLSNRHLDLEPVVGNLARAEGIAAMTRNDHGPDVREIATGRLPSQWTVVARTPAALARIAARPGWETARIDPSVGLWTDDFSSVARVFRMPRP